MILNTAVNELDTIKEEVSAQILNSEVLAKRFFDAKSVIYKVESGEKLISFKPAVKTVQSPKIRLVLALSVVIGGIVGLFFIFLLHIVASYKNRQRITARI